MRRFLAELLYPQAFRDAERFHVLNARVDELATWCFGYAPEAALCGRWLKQRLRVHFMGLEAFNEAIAEKRFDEVEAISICEFREQLIARRHAEKAALEAATRDGAT